MSVYTGSHYTQIDKLNESNIFTEKKTLSMVEDRRKVASMKKLATAGDIAHEANVDVYKVNYIISKFRIKPSLMVGDRRGYDNTKVGLVKEKLVLMQSKHEMTKVKTN